MKKILTITDRKCLCLLRKNHSLRRGISIFYYMAVIAMALVIRRSPQAAALLPGWFNCALLLISVIGGMGAAGPLPPDFEPEEYSRAYGTRAASFLVGLACFFILVIETLCLLFL